MQIANRKAVIVKSSIPEGQQAPLPSKCQRGITALIPVKARAKCKTRLASSLSDGQRLGLVEGMLDNVVNTLLLSSDISRVVVVSPETHNIHPDVEHIPDSGAGLNESLAYAVQRLCREKPEKILILPADLAYLQAEDISMLVDASLDHDVVLTPSCDGGTNALLFSPSKPMNFYFGKNSFEAHQRFARTQSYNVGIVDTYGLRTDIDTISDLESASLLQAPQRVFLKEPLRVLLGRPLHSLLDEAESRTLAQFGQRVTYSRKVFIPLTHLCRDVCHYCTFAKTPRHTEKAYLSIDEVLDIAKAGQRAGCTEALFTLGDKPELRYNAAKNALRNMGYSSTLDYLYACAKAVFEQTGLLPHLNPGLMNRDEMTRLKEVSASMGIMLETTSERLSQKGGPHYGSPDKDPRARLKVLQLAGELKIPFTTGLLIGIGETRRERIETLLAIRDLHRRYGHIQEVIVQNFCPKPDTLMADTPEPGLDEHLWTIAIARIILDDDVTVQAPPNLRPGVLGELLRAGVNDWGGVSPVTPDHVNPEKPWPHLQELAIQTSAHDRQLVSRLPVHPRYLSSPEPWIAAGMKTACLRMSDSVGLARDTTENGSWFAGSNAAIPGAASQWLNRAVFSIPRHRKLARSLDAAHQNKELPEQAIAEMFNVRGDALNTVIREADQLRKDSAGETVSYVINRNINYTNICSYHCEFCAFAKGQGGAARELRGPAYRLDLEEIAARTREAAAMGATEVCLQGGIHPEFTGNTYLSIVRAVKEAVPDIHVHAFSPLEVHHGASTLNLSLADYLLQLKEAGLASLPGTAAEILHDDIRQQICPDKLTTAQWLEVVRTAHEQGIKTTSTIMFGHVEQPLHWAAHLLHLRRLQEETGGITEFVPLPYVHMEAPMWRRGKSRSGPTFREAVLMHAVGRLVLHPLIPNIQTSWVKMGSEGAAFCLQAGANDMGGTLINESITRAAGGVNGQLLSAKDIQDLAASIDRPSAQRTTFYETVSSLPGGYTRQPRESLIYSN